MEPPAAVDDEASGSALVSLVGAMEALTARIESLWSRHPIDGSLGLRLTEAGRAVHRAAVALTDDTVIGLFSSEASATTAPVPADR